MAPYLSSAYHIKPPNHCLKQTGFEFHAIEDIPQMHLKASTVTLYSSHGATCPTMIAHSSKLENLPESPGHFSRSPRSALARCMRILKMILTQVTFDSLKATQGLMQDVHCHFITGTIPATYTAPDNRFNITILEYFRFRIVNVVSTCVC